MNFKKRKILKYEPDNKLLESLLEDYSYKGLKDLYLMKEAKNYNDFIFNLILSKINENFKSKSLMILDFGAGLGDFAVKLRDEGYFSIACVEKDDTLFSIIKKQGLFVSKDIDVFKNETFDFIYLINVLEHIADDSSLIGKFHKKLKKDGKIFVYTPAFDFLYSKKDKHFGHYRRYNKRTLIDLFSKNDFEINEIKYVDPLGFFGYLILTNIFYHKKNNKSNTILSKKKIRFYDKYIFPLSLKLNPLFSDWFGKNIYLLATKKTGKRIYIRSGYRNYKNYKYRSRNLKRY